MIHGRTPGRPDSDLAGEMIVLGVGGSRLAPGTMRRHKCQANTCNNGGLRSRATRCVWAPFSICTHTVFVRYL